MDRLDEDRAEPLGPVRGYIRRLCRLQESITAEVLGHDLSHDCICGEGGFWHLDDTWPQPNHYWSNDGAAIEFIEQAVAEKIERDRHLKPAKADALDRLMGGAL